jgi:hypothetical protein
MKTKTHFAFRIDVLDAAGDNLVEQLAACRSEHGGKLMWWSLPSLNTMIGPIRIDASHVPHDVRRAEYRRLALQIKDFLK